jgi:hypothetical protein
VHWGELNFFFFGHMGAAARCASFHSFWSTFAPPTEDSCQFQKRLKSTWLFSIGCFMVEETDQPIECVQTHFMFFFLRPTTTPLTILVSCEGWTCTLHGGFRVNHLSLEYFFYIGSLQSVSFFFFFFHQSLVIRNNFFNFGESSKC